MQLAVTFKGDPYASATMDTIPRCARSPAGGRADTLVGGPTAQEYDLRVSATRDNKLIIPLTLLVVFAILVVLLRSFVAPVLLIVSVIVSFAAALGAGIFVSEHIFGFTGRRADAAAAGLRLPGRAGDRLQHLPDGPGARGGAEARHPRGHAARAGRDRRGDHRRGLVLAGTFGALAVLPLVVLTQIGFIVAFGVLLDTFVVRSVIVPAP